MERVWLIRIGETNKGPYNILELRCHPTVTPETWVWREGWTEWKRMGSVPELKIVFQDSKPLEGVDSEEEVVSSSSKPKDSLKETLALDLKNSDGYPPFILWLIIMILIMIIVYYRLYWTL